MLVVGIDKLVAFSQKHANAEKALKIAIAVRIFLPTIELFSTLKAIIIALSLRCAMSMALSKSNGLARTQNMTSNNFKEAL